MVSPDLVSNMSASQTDAPIERRPGAYARREDGSIARPGSDREQAREERPVALQSEPQILGGDVIAAVRLSFEAGALVGEDLGESLHSGGDQTVGLLHRMARLVDEAGLDRIPAIAQTLGLVLRKQRRGLRRRSGWRETALLLVWRATVGLGGRRSGVGQRSGRQFRLSLARRRCGFGFDRVAHARLLGLRRRFQRRWLADEVVDQGAVVDHRLAQVLGAGLAAAVAQHHLVRRAVILDGLGVIDREVLEALVEVAIRIAARRHDLAKQVVGAGGRVARVIDETALNVSPRCPEAGLVLSRQRLQVVLPDARRPRLQLRLSLARAAGFVDGPGVFRPEPRFQPPRGLAAYEESGGNDEDNDDRDNRGDLDRICIHGSRLDYSLVDIAAIRSRLSGITGRSPRCQTERRPSPAVPSDSQLPPCSWRRASSFIRSNARTRSSHAVFGAAQSTSICTFTAPLGPGVICRLTTAG